MGDLARSFDSMSRVMQQDIVQGSVKTMNVLVEVAKLVKEECVVGAGAGADSSAAGAGGGASGSGSGSGSGVSAKDRALAEETQAAVRCWHAPVCY